MEDGDVKFTIIKLSFPDGGKRTLYHAFLKNFTNEELHAE